MKTILLLASGDKSGIINCEYFKSKILFFALLFLGICDIVDAQQCEFAINLETVNSTCIANGSVKVTLSGDKIDLSNVFIILTDGKMITDQVTTNGHTFGALPPGEYSITANSVYKGTQTQVSCSGKATVLSEYTSPTFSLGSEKRSSLNCINSGLITLNTKNGRLPYKVEITSKPEAYTGETVFVYESPGTIKFDNLPPGDYSFTVSDACESGSSLATRVEKLNNDFPTDPYQDYLYPSACKNAYVNENSLNSELYPYWVSYRDFYEVAYTFDDDDEKNYMSSVWCCSLTLDLPDTYVNMHAAGAKMKVYVRLKGTECEQLVDEIKFYEPPKAQIVLTTTYKDCDYCHVYFYIENQHIICAPYKWEMFDESNNSVAKDEDIYNFDYWNNQSAGNLLYNHNYTLKVTDANGIELVTDNPISFEKGPSSVDIGTWAEYPYTYDLYYSLYKICSPHKWEVFDADSIFIKDKEGVDSDSDVIEGLEYNKEYIINMIDDFENIVSFHYIKAPPDRYVYFDFEIEGDEGVWSCETYRIKLNIGYLQTPFTWEIMNSDGTEVAAGTDENMVIPFGILEYGKAYTIKVTDGISTVNQNINQNEIQYPTELSGHWEDSDYKCDDYEFRFKPNNIYCFPYKWELFDDNNNLITGKYNLNVIEEEAMRLEYDKVYYLYFTDSKNRTLQPDPVIWHRPYNDVTPYINWRDHEDQQCADYKYSFEVHNVNCFPYKWEIFEEDNPVPIASGIDLTKDDLGVTVDVRLEYKKNYTVKITDGNGEGPSYSQVLNMEAVSYNFTSYKEISNCASSVGYIQIYEQSYKSLDGVRIRFVSGPQTPLHTDIELTDLMYYVHPFSPEYRWVEYVTLAAGEYVFEITDKCGETHLLTVPLNKTIEAKDFGYTLDEVTDVCNGVTRLYPHGKLYANGSPVNTQFSLLESPDGNDQEDILESNTAGFFSLTTEGEYVIGIRRYSWDCDIETVTVDYKKKNLEFLARSGYVCETGSTGHIRVLAINGKYPYTYTLFNTDNTPVEGVAPYIGDETNNYEGAFEYGSFGEEYIVKVSDACGNFSQIKVPITTIDPKTLLSGTENVCKGETVELSCLLLGAEKYKWSGPNGFSEEGSRIITIPDATAANSGEYIIEVVPAGCPDKTFTSSIDITVHEVPLPEVSSPVNLCQAETSQPLAIQPTDGYSIKWYDEYEEPLDEIPVIDHNVLDDYVFHIEYVDNTFGCVGDKKKIEVKVNPLPEKNAEATGWSCQEDHPKVTVTDIVPGYVYTVFADVEATNTVTTFTGGDEATVTDMVLPATVSDDVTFYLKTATAAGCVLPPDGTVEVNIDVDFLEISPAVLPVYFHDVPYSRQITSNAAEGVFHISDGNLITGLNMTADGLISGTVPASTGYAEETFTVTVTDVKGCTTNKTYKLSSCGPAPDIPEADVSYCEGAQSVQLEASSPNDFPLQWYDADMNKLTGTPTPATDVAGEQIFYVTQIDETLQCESGTAKITVTVTPAPAYDDFDAKADGICLGDFPTVTLANLRSDYVYEIYSDAQMTEKLASRTEMESGDVPLSTVPESSTSYFVLVIDNLGCASKGLAEVGIDVTKLEILPVELPVYTHEIPYSVQLTSNAAEGVFHISDGNLVTGISMDIDGLISGTVPESVGREESTFTVTVTDVNGCMTTREYLLRTCEPAPYLPSDSIAYCVGMQAEPVQASSPNGNALRWYDSNLNELSGTPVPSTANAGVQTFYVAQFNESLNCEGEKAEVKVYVNPLPTIDFTASANKVCFGSSPSIILDNLHETYTYTVYSDNAFLNERGSLTETASGTVNIDDVLENNTVYYVLTTDSLGCTSSDRNEVAVEVIKLYIEPEKLPQYYKNTEYEQTFVTNAQSPVFSISSGYLPEGFAMTASGTLYGQTSGSTNNMRNSFTVEVKDSNGCRVEHEYLFIGEVVAPKIFTPNGDGVNDIFMQGYKVVIFDRLGIELFSGDNGWDGTYKGKPVASDIYFYILEYVDPDDNVKTIKGYVGVHY
jgi:gliding motility-associated-like protein